MDGKSGVDFYDYQNEIYKVTTNESSAIAVALESDDVVVGCVQDRDHHTINGYIQFKINSTQKWFEWAENSSIDLTLMESLTLKSLIHDIKENSTDKTIEYEVIEPDGLTWRACTFFLRYNGELCSTEQSIIPHSVYVFKL